MGSKNASNNSAKFQSSPQQMSMQSRSSVADAMSCAAEEQTSREIELLLQFHRLNHIVVSTIQRYCRGLGTATIVLLLS